MSGAMGVEPQARRSEWRGCLPACAVVIAGGLLAFANSFQGTFLFDDKASIVENPCIRTLWQATSAPPQAGLAGRPVASLSFALNYAVGGLDPWGYHAVNLGIHLLCALLIFGLVRRTLLVARLRERYARAAVPLAMLVALLWVVHPLQTSGVTYVVQRIESLMALFYLLTLYCFVRGLSSGRRAWWQAAAVVACALGMLTKEAMVTAPAMVLFYDAVFAAGSLKTGVKTRPGLYAALAATWIILASILAGAPRSETVGFSAGVGPMEYALYQCTAIANYVRLAFWPHPLILDYGFSTHVPLGRLVPSVALLAILLAGTVWALFRRPALAFPGLWFFVILSPTSSFVPITSQLAAEHRMYLPLAGIVALTVIAVHALIERSAAHARLLRRAGITAALAAAGVLGFVTHQRNKDYADPVEMWKKTIAATPPNARAIVNLGDVLYSAGRKEEGIAQFRRAVTVSGGSVMLQCNLATALWKNNQLDEAADLFTRILSTHPQYAEARAKLARTLGDMGRYEEAIAYYQELLQLVLAKQDAVETLRSLAEAQAKLGRANQAEGSLRQALALAPSDPATHRVLAEVLVRQGEFDKAVAEWSEAIRLDPKYAEARRGLARMFVLQGKYSEAVREYEELLRIDPADAQARAALAETRAKVSPTKPP